MANISALVPSCLNGFRSLSDSLAALIPKCGRVEGDISEDLRPLIKNQLGRFRVWSTNLGAHRTGRSSLDYWLRDASHIRAQVINLLNDLLECLQDGASIANGTVEPWDNIKPTSDDEDSDSDSPDAQAPAGLTELSQIVSEASEIINCLFGLSVSIHNPAPHDRFRRSAMTDTSLYEEFDAAHIRQKFPSADQGIVEQLGKANSFRRQYFRYREEHHRKLAQGLRDEGMEPPCDDTKTIADSTVASPLPQHLKTSKLDGSGFENCDIRSEAGRTESSFAPSCAPDGSRSRMPSMPDEAQQGPFECPFCYRVISVETTKEWRKHVFGDLRPYICLYPDCSAAGQDFQRRHQWIQHVQQAHWKILLCPLGCKDLHIEDILALEAHLATFHKEHAETLSPESLIQLSEQERPLDASKKCELCDEELDSFKAYARHVGRHQEDVALFVLPDRGLDEESLSDDQNEGSSKAPEPHNARGSLPDDVDGKPEFMDLILASKRGDTNTIDDLLGARTRKDAREMVNEKDKSTGEAPLYIAAQNGHAQACRALLRWGADANAVVKLLLDTGKVDANAQPWVGRTALHMAAENGHEAVIKLLLDTGKVDADLKDEDGQTALHRAAENGHEAVVKLLLDTGKVDANVQPWAGRTALHMAAENGHEAVVKLLLDTGKADAGAKDENGWTALDMAIKNRRRAVIKLLDFVS